MHKLLYNNVSRSPCQNQLLNNQDATMDITHERHVQTPLPLRDYHYNPAHAKNRSD